MKKSSKIIGIVFCFFLFILIRYAETNLFYDPFLSFFKQTDFNQKNAPEFNLIKLLLSLLFRFGLNSIITIIAIQLWFNDKKLTTVCIYILGISFLFFSLLYLGSILTNFGLGYMPTFYIRRILIQPILFILLLPAIYYYKYSRKLNIRR